ncbi:MAG: DUF177 domain-containing protein [Proteobacteria bacterium]|nr:DUF177 domain-containing protein [Pseudomonadota bacterium]
MIIQNNKLSIGKAFTASSEIPVKDVDAYFADLDEAHALGPMSYDVVLTNRGKHIDLEADIKLSLALCCFRCGQDFERTFDTHLSLKLVEASSITSSDEIVLDEDDLDTVTYQAPNIPIDDLLLESVYLELDGQCLCNENCKGICFNCGQNLNLGDCSCPKS